MLCFCIRDYFLNYTAILLKCASVCSQILVVLAFFFFFFFNDPAPPEISPLSLHDALPISASQGISAGCGVRVIAGERPGYASTDDLSPERILHAAHTAALIASGPAKTPTVGFQEKPARKIGRAHV